MDTTQWPSQDSDDDHVLKPMEENTPCSSIVKGVAGDLERKAKAAQELQAAVNCPRCNSSNTKFCYYNNYSLTQPRYFCKTCKRYWTQGGTLRNIPVGGASRKNKRSTNSKLKLLQINNNNLNPPNNILIHHDEQQSKAQDLLNLGFSKTTQDFKTITELIQVPNFDNNKNELSFNSALELINGISPRSGRFNSFFPLIPIGATDPDPDPGPPVNYTNIGYSNFLMPDFNKPSLSFSLDGGATHVYGTSLQTSGSLLFPFEDLKQLSAAAAAATTTTTTTANDHIHEQNRDQNGDSNGFWNGVLGGGSW